MMSETRENDTTESSEPENFSKPRYEMCDTLREKLQNFPEILKYIINLEKKIKKQRRKLKKIKARFKLSPRRKDVSVQTEPASYNNYSVNNKSEEPKSITEEIIEAAELATQNTGFVYDETSGMYYDSNTGYYYNAEYGLYYDSNTGTYMKYNQELNTYEFHSQVPVSVPKEKQTKEKSKGKKRSKDESKAAKRTRQETDSSQSAEEGECSMTSDNETDSTNSDTSEVTEKWPPCMRVIVEQSQAPKIKIGSLHIVTFEGGTLGREGKHTIILPDINISKCHLKFTYDRERNVYFATDLGSRNGTILNGKRMSSSKQESEALEVAHGSRIQIGTVVLLCHIHEGYKTCGLCEPGLVQNTDRSIEPVPKTTKSQMHRRELKKLKKKFGVNDYDEESIKLASGYTDRAQKRRNTVGSQNPHEKTEVASLNESISSQNKGFKMLAKMGWKEGQSLGKEEQKGLLEPISVVGNVGTSGVGSEEVVTDFKQNERSKQIVWKKTQERFNNISAHAFHESDNELS